ncbi:MAG: TetR/AcrR family transcriptional regulator [Methanobacteriaceae archaeon]|nr:TetR/AcrR family transcriptional regulator [Methanobacteriaceae archaeon]
MSIKDRREREKEQRRNDIINAAEKLFFARGYDEVSMNDIAQEVELSKATLYLYFANKEELFFAIVLRGTLILNSKIKEEVENAEKGIEKVSAFRKAYYEFTKNYRDYIRLYTYFQSGRFDIKRIMNNEYLNCVVSQINKCPPSPSTSQEEQVANQYLNKIMELRSERFSIMCNSIQTGIDDGTIRSDVDPIEAAVLLSSISKRMSDIPPDHEKILESRGIDHDKFVNDVEDLIRHMIMNYNNKQ